MKKLIFILLALCVPVFAQDRVKVADPANPSQNKLSRVTTDTATGNNLTVPGTLDATGNFTGTGVINLLNSQTLTGNGSILTRSLGDARYITNAVGSFVQTNRTISTTSPLTGGGDLSANRTFAFDGTASHNSSGATNINLSANQAGILPIVNGGTGTNGARLPGTWTNLGDFVHNGAIIVSSNITGYGANFSLTNNNLQTTLVSTGLTSSVNIDMYNGQSPVNGAIISFIGATNARAIGTLPLDLLFRSESSGRLTFSKGTAVQGYWDMSVATPVFVILPSSRMLISNTLDVTGIITGTSALNVSSASTFGNNLFVTNVLTASSIVASTNLTVNGKPCNWKQTFFAANLADGSFYDANPPSRFAMSGSAPFMAALVYTNNQATIAPHYAIPASALAGKQLIIRTIVAVNTADSGNIKVTQGVTCSTNLLQNAGWNVGNGQVNSATSITKAMPATAFGAVQFVSTNTLSSLAVAASVYAYPARNDAADTYTSNVFLISTEVEEIQ